MPRYFFHVRDGDELLLDDGEGEEHANLEEARKAAIEGARDMLSEAALSGKAAGMRQQIEVADETGRAVLTVPVGHATDTILIRANQPSRHMPKRKEPELNARRAAHAATKKAQAKH